MAENDIPTMETYGGQHIHDASAKALQAAKHRQGQVRFSFNGTEVIVSPTDTVEEIYQQWNRDQEAAYQKLIHSSEYKEAQAKREAEYKARCAAQMRETAKTEKEMQATESKWPYTIEQLTEYVESLVDREHDYGTCVHAMSLAGIAAMNYVAHKLGVTGFQASCADLEIVRRNRLIKGPFMLLKAEDALYPQSYPADKLREALKEWQPWLAEQAQKSLDENTTAHPRVLWHWKRLAALRKK
jgi:uncharacterized protein YdbL (DUF1318 family)